MLFFGKGSKYSRKPAPSYRKYTFFNIKLIAKTIFTIMICNALNRYDNLYKLVIETHCHTSHKHIHNTIAYLKLNASKIGTSNLLHHVNVKPY